MQIVGRWKPLHLRGAPPHLSAVMPSGSFAEGAVPLSVKLPLPESATMPTTAWIEPLGNAGLNCIQVELPESTPPGDYRGTVEIGKQQCSIVLEIAPRVELRILPATSMVDAQPGARNEFGLTIINVGNVPVEVPKATAFWIYDKQGLDLGDAHTGVLHCTPILVQSGRPTVIPPRVSRP